MGLNTQPSSERVHIGFFGMRNAGKSSVVNAVTNQPLSLVSDTKGTTTDPVKKTMELLPIGPVVIVDTPGIDDGGNLGKLRVERTLNIFEEINVAIVVVDGTAGMRDYDRKLIEKCQQKKVPYIVVINKKDKISDSETAQIESLLTTENHIFVSAKEKENINQLKEMIGKIVTKNQSDKKILEGLVKKDDVVVLVVPIDEAAPKNRLILPQQMVLREILDIHAVSVVTQTEQLGTTLAMLSKKPQLVITDSQAFKQVSEIVPEDIFLTSFSILFARYKGTLKASVEGALKIEKLKDKDTILISEGCTHHRQCGDIGTVKLPRLISKNSGKNLNFEFTSGADFPKDLSKYALVVHCGGCMLNEKNVQSRYRIALKEKVAITNYGITISYLNNILKRSIHMFPEFQNI